MQSKVAFFLIIIKTTCPALREGHTVKLCLPGFLQHQTRNTGAEAFSKLNCNVYLQHRFAFVFVYILMSLCMYLEHPLLSLYLSVCLCVFVFCTRVPGPANGCPIVEEECRGGKSCCSFLQQGTRTPQLHNDQTETEMES